MPDRLLSDLEAGVDGIFTLLTRAAADPKSKFRWPVLSTVAASGGGSARVVVLRGFDRKAVSCSVWTDRRSAKVSELQAQPDACLLFFDPAKKVQIRALGPVLVRTDGPGFEEALSAAMAGDMSDYTAVAGPGTEIDAPGAVGQMEDAAANFARLDLKIDRLDVLELSREGHRRAVFQRRHSGFSGSWRVP